MTSILPTLCVEKLKGPFVFDSAKKCFSKFLSIHITMEFQMAYESMQFTVSFCLHALCYREKLSLFSIEICKESVEIYLDKKMLVNEFSNNNRMTCYFCA